LLIEGWLEHSRHLGSVAFAVIRDRSGRVQLMWSLEDATEDSRTCESNFHQFRSVPEESIVRVFGCWRRRPEKEIKADQLNGDLEVVVHDVEVLNRRSSTSLPFPTEHAKTGTNITNEALRLQYRYLDLRRHKLHTNIKTRSKMTHILRQFLHQKDFIEIETPTLFKSTPEGAREFLVPTRTKNKFYALPQSPQQYKQLLMTAGFERYFQVARCYRDESGRADRQPEFTQLDIEMSFVDADAVMSIVEEMLRDLFSQLNQMGAISAVPKCLRIKEEGEANRSTQPLKRMTYHEAMNSYGTDKPDLRYGMKIVEFSDICRDAGLDPKSGWCAAAKGINAKGLGAKLSRKDISKLRESILHPFADRVYPVKVDSSGNIKLPKVLLPLATHRERMEKLFDISPGDLLFVTSSGDTPLLAAEALGQYRIKAASAQMDLGILSEASIRDISNYEALWITDFPLFEEAAVAVGSSTSSSSSSSSSPSAITEPPSVLLKSVHHPFTAPTKESLQFLEKESNGLLGEKEPAEEAANDQVVAATTASTATNLLSEKILKMEDGLKSQAYDLVINGMELGGGSIRIHDAKLQRMIFGVLGSSSSSSSSSTTQAAAAPPSSSPSSLNDIKRQKEGGSSTCSNSDSTTTTATTATTATTTTTTTTTTNTNEDFKHLTDALGFGTPPHGGIAIGVDRLAAILCSEDNIREVIAFPKNTYGNDPMTGAPSNVCEEALSEYHISLLGCGGKPSKNPVKIK